MSVDSFKPKIWSQELRAVYEKALVFVSLCDRDYEGEIAKADGIVHINTISDPAAADQSPSSMREARRSKSSGVMVVASLVLTTGKRTERLGMAIAGTPPLLASSSAA